MIVKKIGLVGDSGVGKNTFAEKISHVTTHDSEKYLNTIGTVQRKYRWKNDKSNINFELIIWDITSRLEKVSDNLYMDYLEGINGVIIICDITNNESIKHISKWFELINKKDKTVPRIVVINKIDLVNDKEIKNIKNKVKLGIDIKDSELICISALKGLNISEPLIKIGEMIKIHEPTESKVIIRPSLDEYLKEYHSD